MYNKFYNYLIILKELFLKKIKVVSYCVTYADNLESSVMASHSLRFMKIYSVFKDATPMS